MSPLARSISTTIFFSVLFFSQTVFSQTYDMALGYRRSFNSDFIGYNGSNMIRDSLGWPNPYLLNSLPKLNPKNLRYPAGGTANWWNWRIGWFVDRSDLPSGYKNATQKANTLENFKKAVDTTGANVIFVVNMLSSTLPEQIAMLKHADSIGLAVQLVELGSEFYLDGGEDSLVVLAVFPTAQVYAAVASEWADTIHHYFPNAKVAAQGAYNRNNATRRITWDENMFPTLTGEDVISYHAYMSAAQSDENSLDTETFVLQEVPAMLSRSFRMWDILTTEDFPLIPPGKEIWITEYNLRDHVKPVQGSWAHGLFLATQTMLFLNDTRIKHLACHAISGSAVAGAFFFNTQGYEFGSDGHFFPPPNPPAATQYWGLTAGGRVMQQLGLIMKDKTYASPLEFHSAPYITAVDGSDTVSYPALYGWTFVNETSTDAFVVNLSGTDYKVKTSFIFPAGGSYDRYSADPLLYVAYESDITHKNPATLPVNLSLPAYSVTHITGSTVPAPPPTVNMVVTGSTTFCKGDSVKLDAGAVYLDYSWSTGETTKTIWAKNDGDYWVRVRNIKNGYWASDTVHVTVHDLPVRPTIKTIPSYDFCHGDSLVVEVKNPDSALTYNWSSGISGITATIKAGGSYTVTATNSYGCNSISDPTVFIEFALPQPVITPAGPIEICYDESLTLNAGAGYKTYDWSNGKVGQTLKVTASGTYTVTVKDNNNCYGTSGTGVAVIIHEPIDPVITISGPTAFCKGTSPTYLKAPNDYSYKWEKNGSQLAGATDKKYYPTLGGNYKVIITDAWGCSKKSDKVYITVLALPKTKITLASGDKKICVGLETVTLKVQTCSGCTYQWILGGINLPGALGSSFIAALAGDYSYSVTDPSGCTATSNITTITNNCRLSDENNSSEEFISSMNIYPNPASSVVHINAIISENSSNVTMELRNLLGVVIQKQEIDPENGQVSLDLSTSDLPDGMYLVTLQTDDQTLNKMLLIQRK